jgi:hypothetical protein
MKRKKFKIVQTDQPINTLSWEDRWPKRYDDPPTDVSAWRDVAAKLPKGKHPGGKP